MTTLTVPAPRAVPTPLATNLAFIGRSVKHSLREVDALLMAIALPVMLMLVFTYVFGGAIETGGDYINYVVPGIILTCAGFGASSTAVSVNTDMTEGIINRFRTMPLQASAVITGHAIASLLRNLVATGIVFVVGLLIGFRPSAGPLGWLAAFGVIALYILAITWIFAVLGLLARSPGAASGYGFGLLFLPYVSSAFVPVDTMPSWLRAFAEHQPLTPINETIRGLLMNLPLGNQPWWALGWCLVILIAGYLWGRWLFPRRLAH
ncbi:ABC transporter permease [Microlunatus sp. GCM10028923]|uniref:ABC transporter permease n=1 Tax=Microlunatus sp. GCM10028923 TaxID=3273400 RepID=UPI003619F15A